MAIENDLATFFFRCQIESHQMYLIDSQLVRPRDVQWVRMKNGKLDLNMVNGSVVTLDSVSGAIYEAAKDLVPSHFVTESLF